jgi:hypothetical protein
MYPPMLTFGVTEAPAQLPELKPRFTATGAREVQAGAGP